MSVKRYNIRIETFYGKISARTTESESGEWVSYDDYEKLESENAALKKCVADLSSRVVETETDSCLSVEMR